MHWEEFKYASTMALKHLGREKHHLFNSRESTKGKLQEKQDKQ